MEKKIKQIFWILGITILVILILDYNSYQKSQEGIEMKVHYYRNGIEVFPEKTLKTLFSIITPPNGSYDAIQIEVQATNTGNLDLINMQIIDATPLAFKNALPATTKGLSKGETKILWISNIMNTSQFESMAQPVKFWVNISGQDASVKTVYSEKFINLTITPEQEISSTFLNYSSSFYLYDQWYSGYYMTSTNDYLWIFESGINPIIRKYNTIGQPENCLLSGTKCTNINFNIWRPEGLRDPITNSFPLQYFGIYTNGNYIWVATSDVAIPYTRYIAWFDMNDNKIGRFNLTTFGNQQYPQGLVIANNYLYVGDRSRNNVLKYDLSGSLINTYPITSGFRDFAYKDNQFFVTDGIKKIRTYDTNWNYIASYDVNSSITNPYGISYSDNSFWITDATDDQRKVYKFLT